MFMQKHDTTVVCISYVVIRSAVVENNKTLIQGINRLPCRPGSTQPHTTPSCVRFVIFYVFGRNSIVYYILFYFILFTLLLSSLWTSRGHRCRPFPPPPGSCFQFLSRIGFSNPTARRFFVECVANSRSRAFRKSICAQEKVPTNLYEHKHLAGLELAELTYTRLKENLIRHRGDRSIDTMHQLWHRLCVYLFLFFIVCSSAPANGER